MPKINKSKIASIQLTEGMLGLHCNSSAAAVRVEGLVHSGIGERRLRAAACGDLLSSLTVQRFRRGWMHAPACALVPGKPDA
jgi:hypothetical protein